MERIKDLEKVKLTSMDVLMEVHQNESSLLDKNGQKTVDFLYGNIVAISPQVEDVSPGDIVVKTIMNSLKVFDIGDKVYCIVPRVQLTVVVSPNNFEYRENQNNNIEKDLNV